MSPDTLVELLRSGIVIAVELVLPIVAVAFLVSVVVGVAQALTSMQDATLSTIPRIIAAAATAVVTAPWVSHKLLQFSVAVIEGIGRIGR